ncbi:MAG TPA: hypothetical protein VM096_10115, partial [Vicinamibacterales bacterium]|nr:hypothetical protein [Vicinamibacterales bacterium]
MSGHRTARVLVYTHRWLGIVSGVLFVLWFVSGIVMMYARMPELGAAERLARLPDINSPFIRVLPPTPSEGDITRLVIGTLEGRPVFRVTARGRTQLTFADTGDPVPPVDADQALRIARRFVSEVNEVRYDTRLTDADQWSFGVRGRMPIHRIDVADTAGTQLYVTENGGDVVLKTTASGRFWGWTGAVVHWLYFAPFRRQAALWNETIVWLSIAGTLMCLAGIVWGVWRLAPLRGYRLRDHRQWSPYAGWMRWHHYAGLIFGIVTTTWIFSGLLSMDPWDWHPSTAPTREQRARVAGGSIAISDLSLEKLRKAIDAYAPHHPKEVEITRFRGHYYAAASDGIVSIDQPQFGALDQLAPDLVVGAANVAMDGVAIEG